MTIKSTLYFLFVKNEDICCGGNLQQNFLLQNY